MKAISILREMVRPARHLDPIQFVVVSRDGVEEGLWVDARSSQPNFLDGFAAASTTVRIDEEGFLEALGDDSRLLRVGLEQLFMKKKISVEGRVLSFETFIDLAHQWQCPPRPPSTKVRAAKPAAVKIPTYPRLEHVERRTSLGKEELFEKFVGPGLPVIFPQLATSWPLLAMSLTELGERLAPFQGFVRAGDYAGSARTGEGEREYVVTPLDRYLSSLDDTTTDSTEPPPYLGNNPFPDALYDLIELPHYFDRSAYTAPRMWIGPRDTLTPLHRDANDNIFVQVSGKKRFTIAAPDQADLVYCAKIWAEVDPEKPDYERFPRLRDAHFLTFEVERGDVLFLPEAWFHHVRSLTPSVSLNSWMVHSRGIFAALQR